MCRRVKKENDHSNKHGTYWDNIAGTRRSRLVLKGANTDLNENLLNMIRKDITVTGLLIGHGHLQRHLNTISLVTKDPVCRLSGSFQETAQYRLLE